MHRYRSSIAPCVLCFPSKVSAEFSVGTHHRLNRPVQIGFDDSLMCFPNLCSAARIPKWPQEADTSWGSKTKAGACSHLILHSRSASSLSSTSRASASISSSRVCPVIFFLWAIVDVGLDGSLDKNEHLFRHHVTDVLQISSKSSASHNSCSISPNISPSSGRVGFQSG